MTFTVTALPSAADTHGSHKPKLTTPFVSTAPSVPSGSRLRAMASQRAPLDAAEEQAAGVGLQSDEARILRRRRQAAARRLRIAGEVELIYHLSIERHGQIRPIDGDLVIVPLANRMRLGWHVRALESVDCTRAVDRR